MNPWTLLSDDSRWHTPTQVLHPNSHTAVIREREGVETHTLLQSKDRSALTAVLNPSAVDGTNINFSPFSWAARPPDARNNARKERAPPKPEIKNE